MSQNKDNRVLAACQLPLPLLGIPDLPRHLTKFELLLNAEDIITIRCEFYPEKYQLDALTKEMQKITQEYDLVKKGTYEFK